MCGYNGDYEGDITLNKLYEILLLAHLSSFFLLLFTSFYLSHKRNDWIWNMVWV